MFTGLVTAIGTVSALSDRGAGDTRLCRLSIACDYAPEGIALGASIACSGPCLTAVSVTPEGSGTRFDVELSSETLDRTTAGGWQIGTSLNLERSLTLGAELGGHLVTGHIDAVAEIVAREDLGDASRFVFDAPARVAGFIAEKGSICLDGTSLTVNGVTGTRFDVMLIPHTLDVTTWGAAKAGDRVNLEVDLLARYVARMAEWTNTSRARSEGQGA